MMSAIADENEACWLGAQKKKQLLYLSRDSEDE